MKKMKRFASAALAALMLAGSMPSALALDATPPLYQQFGYDNADDYMEQEAWFTMLDYDAASDLYRQYMDTIHKKPQVALDYYGYESLAALDEEIEWGAWESREDFYRYAAIQMVSDDDWELHRQLTVQLNGDMIKFPDARPEKVNGRVMVPFRAIAEALGAEVDYNAGAITAKKDGETLSFALGGKQLTVTDSTGKVVKTTPIDTVPYKKGGRTYVPVRFFAEGFGLTVQWDGYYQTAVLYDREALVEEINSEFTVLSDWIKAQPMLTSDKALRTTAAVSAVYTMFDTLDGNKDYKVSATLNVLSDGKSTEMNATLDLRTLAELMVGEDAPENITTAAALATLKSVLSHVTIDVILDGENGGLYLRCPALAKVLLVDDDGDDAYADVRKLANGGWLHIDLEDLGISELFGVLTGSNSQIPYTSVGESLVAAREKQAQNSDWFDWEDFCDLVQNERESLGQIVGDSVFTKSGTRYTAKLDEDDGWGTTTKGSYTLNTADGSFSGSVVNRTDTWGEATQITMTFSGTLRSGKYKLTLHRKNESEITFEITLGTAESADAPKNAPPEGSTIVEWTYEGSSDEYPDWMYNEDGSLG